MLNPSSFYALIIGNNTYPKGAEWHSLKGAIADARSFQSFLLDKIGVPKTHIRFMKDANRCDMVDALEALKGGKLLMRSTSLFRRSTSRIKIPKGSTFVLFYAGHGGRTPVPESWKGFNTTDGYVEQLVPSDIGSKDRKGKTVTGIPDRLISAVLTGLVKSIGDNVTVILDCCHSLGQTRAPQFDGQTVRCLEGLPPLDDAADTDIFDRKERSRGLSRGPRGSSATTVEAPHMLLAACQQDQFAQEANSQGAFTKALLDVLCTHDIHGLTYACVMLQIRMPNNLQIPACFGSYQDRVIFSTTTGKPTQDLYVGRFYSENSTSIQIVHGGLVHGIREGDEFTLYDISADQNTIGTAKATKCYAICSDIVPDQSIQCESFYCKLNPNLQQLKLYIDPSVQGLPDIIGQCQTSDPQKASIIISEVPGDSEKVAFSFGPGDAIVAATIPEQRLPFLKHVPKHDVEKVLMSMVRFRKFLDARMDNLHDAEDISVQFVHLADQKRGFSEDSICPSDKTEDIYRTEINVEALRRSYNRMRTFDRSKSYSMSIKNLTEEPLFTYVVRCDPGTLTIDPWYCSTYFTPDIPLYWNESEKDFSVAAELKSNTTIKIGQGNSGVLPYRFWKDETSAVDIKVEKDFTFFKIILTKSPADFSMLIQDSPSLATPPDVEFRRDSTGRSGILSPPTQAQISQDAKARVKAYFRETDEAKKFLSVNFLVSQTIEGQ